MNTDLISILMPVRNASPFLRECLDSILAQETAWELIAVDDSSVDDSRRILEEYALRDNRIKVLENEGKGIIQALRTAFSESSGDFVTRMDADDKMAPSKLVSLRTMLEKSGGGHVAVGLVKVFSDTDIGDGYLQYERWLNDLSENRVNYEAIYRECVIPSPCWMVYRSDLVSSGAFQPDIYPEDYDLCFRFYRQRLHVVSCQEILHFWRDHPGRTSRNDDHYSDQTFFGLKVKYFLELDRIDDRRLFIWGAGKKGKSLAKMLLDNNESFSWICDNSKKEGNEIYGVIVSNYEILEQAGNFQVLVAVSSPADREQVRNYFLEHNFKENRDFYFFC